MNEITNNYWGATICDVIQDDGLCIKDNVAVSYRGNPTSITIPNSVTSIGACAFYGCRSLTSITILDSVTSIGDMAFYFCTNLTFVTIPSSITRISVTAFHWCSKLKYIICTGATPALLGASGTFPQGTVYVPIGAKPVYSSADYWKERIICEGFVDDGFILQLVDNSHLVVDGYIGNTGVTDVLTIPSSAESCGQTYNITQINSNAFAGDTSLVNVVMPNSIEAIGKYAFQGCSNLKSITLSKNVTGISDYAFQNCISLKNIAIPAGAITIGSFAFGGCKSLSTVTMKDYVTSIGNGCFCGCESLTNITLSKKITWIPSYAFQDCKSLPSISLSGIVSIGDCAYDGCISIPEVSIPVNCTFVTTAFNGCTALKAFTVDANNTSYSTIDGVLTNYDKTQIIAYPSAKGSTYTLPSTITSIGQNSFRGSELTSISIPSTVSTIYDYAFANCKNLAKVIFENSSSSIDIGDHIFQKDSLESVEIYRELNMLKDYYGSYGHTPFYEMTSLKSVIIGGSFTSVLTSMFQGCTSLSSVAMSDAITSIGQSAFQDCANLASIKLPATVTDIGDAFLSGCSGLREINAKMQNPPVLPSTAFTGVDKEDCKLIVPAAYVDTYNETPGWMAFNNIVAEEEKPTYTCGDANGDSSIDVADISATASKILGSEPAGFLFDAADVNEDKEIDVADISGIANIILNGMQVKSFGTGNGSSVLIEGFDIKPGETKEVAILLNNPGEEFTGLQLDLYLPKGITIPKEDDEYKIDFGSRTTYKKHSLESALQEDGAIRLLMYSAKNNIFSGNSGDVIILTLKADESINVGTSTIEVKNIVLSKADGSKAEPENCKCTVTVKGDDPEPSITSVYVSDFEMTAGKTKEVSIMLNNPDDDFTGLQLDLYLPEGITIPQEDDEYKIDFGSRTTYKKHSLESALQEDGAIRLLMYSAKNNIFSGNIGDVITVTLNANGNLKAGTKAIELKNIVLSRADGSKAEPEDSKANVTISIYDDIETIQSIDTKTSIIYNLAGSKMATPQKGINIINGKKYFVR